MDMGEDPPRIEARWRRALAYLQFNRSQILVDISVLTAWILGTWALFGYLGLTTWLMYIVLFVGVVIYSRLTPTWERPYRSPDLEDHLDSDELEEG